jgi:hypothetical protein
MEQVESGAKKIPSSKIGEGVEETAKGIGTTAERQGVLYEALLELTYGRRIRHE